MDRITGKEVQSMMEAYASVYIKEEVDQEVISEEVEELDENRQNRARAIRAAREAESAEQDRLYRAGGGDAKRQETRQMQGASRARVRRPGMTRDQVIELGRKNLAAKASTSTSTGTAPAAPANNAAASKAPAPKPAANPNVTAGGTKFERRLPTMAELRAAQQARRDAPKVLSRSEIENRAVKAGVNAGKPASAPAANTAKPAAAVGSAASSAASSAAKPAVRTGNINLPTPRPRPTGARPMGARNRMRMEELDIFETIKQYLVDEGYSEDEALKAMTILTDEERTEILEGSCGSKSKKKKKGGYGK